MTPRVLLAVIVLVLIAFVVACHDEIPVVRDSGDSVVVVKSDSDEGSSQAFRYRHPKETLSYGVTEQEDYPRFVHMSYRVASRGAAWDGVSLNISCIVGSLSLRIGNLPWQEQNRGTLLITLDDQPPLAEDMYLHRINIYHRNDMEKTSSADLEDDVWYERLRSAETLTIGLLNSDLEPVTFDLTRFFGTPLQDEFDNCSESSVSAPQR